MIGAVRAVLLAESKKRQQRTFTPNVRPIAVVRTEGPLSSPGNALGMNASPLSASHGLGKGSTAGEYASFGVQVFELPITKGAVIHSAKLRFTADSSQATSGDVPLSIAVHDVDDATDIDFRDFSIILGQTWGTRIDWPTTPWPNGSVQETPELAALVQHIVDRPGWSAGKNIRLFVGAWNAFSQHRKRGFNACELFIDFTQ